MTPSELINIIAIGENENTEFKSSFNKEVIETIVAFANSKGGRVLIGISDKNKILGVDINNESTKNWLNEIKSKTTPSLIPTSEIITIQNKNIIGLTISEHPIKPVSYLGKYFKRKSNSNHQLSVSEISELFIQNMKLSWDSYPHDNASIEDLDHYKISNFIKKVNNTGRFLLKDDPKIALEKLGLINEKKISHAAIILFSKELIDYKIRIGRFKSPSHIISDKVISGTLFEAW